MLTGPLDLNAQLRVGHLVALATSDALVRYRRSRGFDVRWVCGCTTGDLAGQHEVDRDLVREGLDRTVVEPAAFVDRVRSREAASRVRVSQLAGRLGIDLDLDAGALDGPRAALAARTAFVRLFEAGLLSRREEVVDTCPTCASVVDGADREPADVEGEAVVLKLGESLEVTTEAPEQLAATVAVVIPEGAEFDGTHVELPIDGRDVPVVRDADVSQPRLLAPVDGESHSMALRLGLTPTELFDVDGVAHHDGPLDGLPRFAARTAARDLLAADGVIVRTRPVSSAVGRCRHCRTVLVPRLASQWMLDMAALEHEMRPDVERQVAWSPPVIATSGPPVPWCVSREVLAGQPIPAVCCRDCGRLSVGGDSQSSCRYCMSRDVVPERGVLDSAFVAAAWPLAAQGWPDRQPSSGATLVASDDADTAMRMFSLGSRLSGTVPFAAVVVMGAMGAESDGDQFSDAINPDEFDQLITAETARVVRVALVRGDLDVRTARRLVEAFDHPNPAQVTDVGSAEEAFHAAMANGGVAQALEGLAAACRLGVGDEGAARLRRLAEPVWGAT